MTGVSESVCSAPCDSHFGSDSLLHVRVIQRLTTQSKWGQTGSNISFPGAFDTLRIHVIISRGEHMCNLSGCKVFSNMTAERLFGAGDVMRGQREPGVQESPVTIQRHRRVPWGASTCSMLSGAMR